MVDTHLLFDFTSGRSDSWSVVNDGVMGGRSKGYFQIERGVLRFSGTLVTRGGGFTSVRTFQSFDLAGFEGLELKVRGNGRSFEVEVNDGQRVGWRGVSRRAPFETQSDWQTVRVPFSALRATIFGRRVDAPPVDLSEIERIGFYILDGRDGPFELEVEFIRAYRAQ
ncbi:CIA30 family protein [Wenzhouxiangella sediminis]|nr:CIA30 family protein [Wenzhouxiangella sediminis]